MSDEAVGITCHGFSRRTRPADLDEKQRAALGRVLLKFSVLRPKAKDLAGISDPWMFKIENYHEVPKFSGSRLFQSSIS